MISQDFLLILVFLIGLVIFWTWQGRKPRPPVKLNLKAGDSAPLLLPEEEQKNQSSESPVKRTPSKYDRFVKAELPSAAMPASSARNLNILFNYNGHTWDAYEVFGLPAGASLADVTQAYQFELRRADPASHAFLETAYRAILDRQTL